MNTLAAPTGEEPIGTLERAVYNGSRVPSGFPSSGYDLTETTTAQNRVLGAVVRIENHAYDDVALVFLTGNLHDRAGIVFRWVDDEHYYFFCANEQRNRSRFYKRDRSGVSVLGTANDLNIDWSDGVIVDVSTIEDTFTGSINHGIVLTANDSDYPIGKFGLYSYAMGDNGGVNFDNFNVTPTPPEEN